jgi:hypothetical protein
MLQWELAFDEKGGLRSSRTVVEDVASAGVTDLFVLCHGWNTSAADAREMYDELVPLIDTAAARLGKVGYARVVWPSLWFPDTPATAAAPAGAQQAAGAMGTDRTAAYQLSGARIAESLARGFEDSAQQKAVAALGRLLDDADDAARTGAPDELLVSKFTEFHAMLRSITPPLPEFEDAGERALLATTDPVRTYQDVAEVFGSAPTGAAPQGVGDWFGKALGGAKDALRVFSYTVMKARAGEIGRRGLGPLLAALHGRSPGVRVHLVGHSFGARLVSFALTGVGTVTGSPIASLVLLQAAFSHWSFSHATDNPFGEDGALHSVADRVHGPLVATFSEHDLAVCRWYPKASFLARQDQSGNDTGRWAGLGADGFQAVRPLADRTMLANGTTAYGFKPRTFYRVDAGSVINKNLQAFSGAHNDILKTPVAKLIAAAASGS